MSKQNNTSQEKNILFIDRDGTLIIEPPITFQINSLEEMVFLPWVISSLKKLYKAGYQLVLVTNQDWLWTSANPRTNYEIINDKIFQIFEWEGIKFLDVFECVHFEDDQCECRKPKLWILWDFLNQINISHDRSYVIWDRESDMQFAKNIGINWIKITTENNWESIVDKILST